MLSAERQRVHRKKRIAVSADLLNATADSDSDDATELPDTTTGMQLYLCQNAWCLHVMYCVQAKAVTRT